jgi:hypothetical protein
MQLEEQHMLIPACCTQEQLWKRLSIGHYLFLHLLVVINGDQLSMFQYQLEQLSELQLEEWSTILIMQTLNSVEKFESLKYFLHVSNSHASE